MMKPFNVFLCYNIIVLEVGVPGIKSQDPIITPRKQPIEHTYWLENLCSAHLEDLGRQLRTI